MRLPRPVLQLLLLSHSSCATLVAPPERVAGTPPAEAWSRVLDRFVDDEGRVDFEGLRADSADLDAFVAHVAQPVAEDRESREAALARQFNAYNALAMYNVLHAGVLPKQKFRFFYLRELEVFGSRMSLYDFENEVIRATPEPRMHFALNCMVRDCPRLRREPYDPALLEQQLDDATREFIEDERRVRVDEERGVLLLSPIFDWYEEDFLAVAPSLIEYIARHRELGDPRPTRVEFLDYDWTLNAQSRPAPTL